MSRNGKENTIYNTENTAKIIFNYKKIRNRMTENTNFYKVKKEL